MIVVHLGRTLICVFQSALAGPDIAGMDPEREKVYREILHIVEHCILPALTRGVGSSALSEQVFVLLKAMPYNLRLVILRPPQFSRKLTRNLLDCFAGSRCTIKSSWTSTHMAILWA